MASPNHLPWLPRLLALWSIPALVTLAGMLTHRSDAPVLLGRYSLPVAAMLAGLALLIAALIGSALALRGRSDLLARIDGALARLRERPRFAPVVLILAGVALAGLWLFFLGSHLITYALLRLFLGATIAVGALAVLFGGEASPAPARWTALALAALAVLALLALLTVEFYPAMYRTDEAFIFDMARHAAESGHTGPTIYRHAIPQDYGAGGLWTWFMAAWLKVGGISFASGRLYIFVIGLAALILAVGAARRAYGPAAGWFAALIGLAAVMSLDYIRNDMPCALFLALALLFYRLAQERPGWWLHLLAGLSVGLCIDSAPIGYCFGLGLGLFYLVKYVGLIRRERRWFWPPFWALAAGGALALIVYLLARAGSSYAANAGAGSGSIGEMLSAYAGSFGSSITSGYFVDMIGQVLTTWLTNQPVLFGLTALGVVAALRERGDMDRLLLTLLAAWMAVIILTYHYFPALYLVHGLPVALLLAGRGAAWGLSLLLRSGPADMNALGRAAALLLATWLLAAFAHNLAMLASLEDVVEAGRQIARVAPLESVIVAAEPYYFGMPDHRGFVGGAVEGMIVEWQGRAPEEAWEIVAPDAVVFSEHWAEPPRTPALLAYLEEHAFALAGCWQTAAYGRVELWMADAASALPPDAPCQPVCVARWGTCTATGETETYAPE